MVQWLGISTSHCWGPGSIPGPETKIAQAVLCGQKNKYVIQNKEPLDESERGE